MPDIRRIEQNRNEDNGPECTLYHLDKLSMLIQNYWAG